MSHLHFSTELCSRPSSSVHTLGSPCYGHSNVRLFTSILHFSHRMHIDRQNGARSFSKRMMVLACVTMYAMAATHWAMSVRCVVLEQRNARTLLDLASSCIVALSNGAGCTAEVTGSQNLPTAQANISLLTALLSVNVSITFHAAILRLKRILCVDCSGRFHRAMESLDTVGTKPHASGGLARFTSFDHG